jgi:hypothetical protein
VIDLFQEVKTIGQGDRVCASQVTAHWVESLHVLVIDTTCNYVTDFNQETTKALENDCPPRRYLETYDNAADAVRRTVEVADKWHNRVEEAVEKAPRHHREAP